MIKTNYEIISALLSYVISVERNPKVLPLEAINYFSSLLWWLQRVIVCW